MAINGYLEPSDFGFNIKSTEDLPGFQYRWYLMFTFYQPQFFTRDATPVEYLKPKIDVQTEYYVGNKIEEAYFSNCNPPETSTIYPFSAFSLWREGKYKDVTTKPKVFGSFPTAIQVNNPKYVNGVMRTKAGDVTDNYIRGLFISQLTNYEVETESDWDTYAIAIDKSAGNEQWDPYEAISSFHIKELIIRAYNRLTYEAKTAFDVPIFGGSPESEI
jgi:hypothetical protein